MRKVSFLLLIVICVLSGKAQTIIEPSLLDEMKRCSDNEKIEVFVLMKSQYNRAELNHRAEYFATRAERREFVVNELKNFAEASQCELKMVLGDMEKQGLVSSPRSLWTANALYFSATKQVIFDLSERNDIEIIGYNVKKKLIPETGQAYLTSPVRETTPNIPQVNADKVWELGYRGKGVVVAVVDSGVNYNHLDVASRLWDGGEEFPHHGYDIVNDDDDPMDDLNHGTHCAGTVLGDGTSGSLTGIAPEATLMCVKSIDSTGFGGAVNIAGGMEWSVEHGCDLISMSLGMAGSELSERTLLRRTCESVLDAGIIAAVCAGNEGLAILQWSYPIPDNVRVPASCPPPYLDPDQVANPGGLTCVMAVGAVDYNDTAADFSSQGPVTWQETDFGDYAYNPGIGLIRPDVCAPGVNIKSLDYLTNDGYVEMSGTSMATPCVAGIIALMLEKNPELTPAEICRILEETSVKLTETKSNITGVGRVDALAAIQQVPEWNKIQETPETQILIYPNPTNDVVNVKCDDMNLISIFSIDGRFLGNITPNGSECRIEGLQNGVYLLKIETRNSLIIKMVVKN